MSNLLKNTVITRVKNAVVAGTSDQTGVTVDMVGFDSAMCIACVGALSATQVTSLRAQGGSDSGGSGASDLLGTDTGAMADADSNKTLLLEIVKPRDRYLTFVLKRGTANAVLDSMVVIQYQSAKKPSAQGTTNSKTKLVVSPAVGAA